MARVADLMSRAIVSVSRSTRVGEAVRRAKEAAIHHLLVLENGELVGVLCTCDLRSSARLVADCMSPRVVTIDVEADAGAAAAQMRRHGVGSLPVTSGGRVVGIVTASDFHRAGMPLSMTGKTFCSACGAMHHVRSFHGSRDVAFCIECLERNGEHELGGSG